MIRLWMKRLKKEKEKLDVENYRLLRESDKMSMETLKEDVDDDFLKVNHRLSFRYDFLALKLFALGLSLSQVEKALKQIFEELKIDYDVPGHSCLSNLRQDLGSYMLPLDQARCASINLQEKLDVESKLARGVMMAITIFNHLVY